MFNGFMDRPLKEREAAISVEHKWDDDSLNSQEIWQGLRRRGLGAMGRPHSLQNIHFFDVFTVQNSKLSLLLGPDWGPSIIFLFKDLNVENI